MKKKTKLYVVSFFMLFIYVMGLIDMFMMLSHNQAYYLAHSYGLDVVEYFTNYPAYFFVLWLFNIICGITSPLLLMFKDKLSITSSLVSFISDLLLIILTVILRNRIGILGIKVFLFDIFILVITFLFYLFTKKNFMKVGGKRVYNQ